MDHPLPLVEVDRRVGGDLLSLPAHPCHCALRGIEHQRPVLGAEVRLSSLVLRERVARELQECGQHRVRPRPRRRTHTTGRLLLSPANGILDDEGRIESRRLGQTLEPLQDLDLGGVSRRLPPHLLSAGGLRRQRQESAQE